MYIYIYIYVWMYVCIYALPGLLALLPWPSLRLRIAVPSAAVRGSLSRVGHIILYVLYCSILSYLILYSIIFYYVLLHCIIEHSQSP